MGETVAIVDAMGKHTEANTTGSLKLDTLRGELNIDNVLECSAVEGTLLSVKQFLDEGYKIEFKTKLVIVKKNNLVYYFPWSEVYRLGHFGSEYINRAGIPIKSKYSHFCPGCIGTKPASKKKKMIIAEKTTTTIPTSRLQVIFMDTFGPIQRSKIGNRFFVVLVCQFTGYLAGFPTSSKGYIAKQVIQTIGYLSKLVDRKPQELHVLRSDQGTEFQNSKLHKFREFPQPSVQQSLLKFDHM